MSELLTPDDTRDGLRKLGGLLLGLGFLMWLLRVGSVAGDLGKFLTFILFLIPTVVLYGGGVFTRDETGGLRSWQPVYAIFGLLLIPGMLLALVNLLGGDTGASLNTFWVFGVTAAAGAYATIRAGIRAGLLLGSIALIISWSGLWDKILSDGLGAHIGVYRGLLGILAIILLVAALHVWRTNPGPDEEGDDGTWKASELLTGAGIAAVLGCSLGITAAASLNPFSTPDFQVINTNWFWDTLLLAISLGLVGLGSLIGRRGPIYIGAIGLALFLLIAGLDLDGDPPDPGNFGIWPIILLVLGAVGIGVSFLQQASLGDKPRKKLEAMRKM
ncbi:MAG: hypothetical protein EXQ70_08230 [Solirubrobacterales bacterium]|nr:hypothetical protein [Solirubrobacterales bacterium]